MLGLLSGIIAILSALDLFADHGERVLPWWGDVIVLGSSGVFYVATRLLIGDDD